MEILGVTYDESLCVQCADQVSDLALMALKNDRPWPRPRSEIN